MIHLGDSCSCATGSAISGAGASVKYIPRRNPLPNPNFTSGRYGGFAYFFNVSSGGQVLLTRPLQLGSPVVFDSRNLIVVNGYDSEVVIWIYRDNATPTPNYFAMVTLGPDGRLRIYSGGDGINPSSGVLVYTSQTVLAINTWYSVDMAWTFTGSGQMSLYIDDTLDTGNPGHPSVVGATWGASGTPYACALCWNNNAGVKGMAVSDLVVNDASGLYNTGRLGPCRVGLYFPFADAQPITSGPWVLGGAEHPTTGAQALSELPGFSSSGDAPDGDFSFISAVASGTYLATMGRRVGSSAVQGLDCYGLILGIALSACIREPAQLAQDFAVVPNPSNGSVFTIPSSPVTADYRIAQGISEVRPDTLTGWTDGDASNAWWGVAYTAGTPVVTQLVLEKITSTRGVPFNCGGSGSYTYQGTPSL